jgi:hypothetical protein
MAPALRDVYENDVDFAALALQDAAFAKKYFSPWSGWGMDAVLMLLMYCQVEAE